MAIVIKAGDGVSVRKANTYNLRFDFNQTYDIVIQKNLEDSKKHILDILKSEDLVKENFECTESFDDDVFKYELFFVSISDVDFDINENDKNGYEGSASREISISYLITIYDFDTFNREIENSYGITISEEYDDEDEESSDVIQACSMFTGFYAEAENDSFSIEFSSETSDGKIETKMKIG